MRAGAFAGRVVSARAAPALAAAFISFLNARTFCSESSSTTSATERNDARLAVVTGGLAPAARLHAELLAEQGGEDLRLLLAEAGQPRRCA